MNQDISLMANTPEKIPPQRKRLTRRESLKEAFLAATGLVLAGCNIPPRKNKLKSPDQTDLPMKTETKKMNDYCTITALNVDHYRSQRENVNLMAEIEETIKNFDGEVVIEYYPPEMAEMDEDYR